MLVVVLIAWVLSTALSLIPVVGAIIGAVVTTPIMAVAQTLLYCDLRHRHGGYTTGALAGELGV